MEFPSINNNGISSTLDAVKESLQNPLIAAAAGGAAGLAIGAAVTSAVKNKSSKKRSSSKRRKKKGKKSRDRIFKSKQKHEQKYKRKRKYKIYKKKGWIKPKRKKSSSRKGIRYTKNGQPYKILSNGRARFIKKRSKN